MEGGDNEDNQTHGPLIDMIEVEVCYPQEYHNEAGLVQVGPKGQKDPVHRCIKLTMDRSCDQDRSQGRVGWVCTSSRGAC